jgi:hypothetical protein
VTSIRIPKGLKLWMVWRPVLPLPISSPMNPWSRKSRVWLHQHDDLFCSREEMGERGEEIRGLLVELPNPLTATSLSRRALLLGTAIIHLPVRIKL